MAFQKEKRSCQIKHGWRLATVAEAKKNVDSIKDLFSEWDRARLLDGWIGGSGYDFLAKLGFRSCLGYMLIVESKLPEISSSDGAGSAPYDEVTLSDEGKWAAFFLCSEDWNYEVVCWVLNDWLGLSNHGINEERLTRNWTNEFKGFSELISTVARELQSTVPIKNVTKRQFSRTSVRAMTSDIVKLVQDKVRSSDKSSEDLLTETLSSIELMDVGNVWWKEIGLTEDLSRFQEFGLDTKDPSTRESIADAVLDVAADAVAVTIARDCVMRHDRNFSRLSLSEKRMGDVAFISSIVSHANRLLSATFKVHDGLWRVVREAAEASKGTYHSFTKILSEQRYGTFSYQGSSHGVLNTILLQAAKKGDVKLVKRLIKCGVQPLDTYDKRKKTALHHASKLYNESDGLEIAETLLGCPTNKELANAMDLKERTPLHRAALSGHARMCELLLNHEANVYSRDKNGQIPLHYAFGREQQNEEVIRLLISADEKDCHEKTSLAAVESPEEKAILGKTERSVDVKDNHGKTPLHFAVECQGITMRMVTGLLSLSNHPEEYFKNSNLQSYLRESARRGHHALLKKLLSEGANPLDRDREGKTALHYAAEGRDQEQARKIINEILLDDKEATLNNEELAKARDKFGRSVLHVAAFVGHKDICRWLLSLEILEKQIDTKDRDGQSALYYAVAGSHDDDEVLDAIIFRDSSREVINIVDLIDSTGTTPLHLAAARGNFRMVAKLLSKRLISNTQNKEKFVRAADVLGQTALHKAASGGHKIVVKKLLDEGAHPLEERDCDGKTALHYAVQAEDCEDAKAIAKLLLNKCASIKEKSLLLFASAVGIGSAEESLDSNSFIKNYLAAERCRTLKNKETENLLKVAATLGNVDMTREFLTAGAQITEIRSPKWRASLPEKERQNVNNVLKQIDNSVEQGTDKPALWDTLGRSVFANGLAALFLNPFVKSPITVGLSGEWGMGKSSLMLQTEAIILKTAAKLAFSTTLQDRDIPGASKSKLSKKGKATLEDIELSVGRLSRSTSTAHQSHSISQISEAEEPASKSKYDITGKFAKLIKCLFCIKQNNVKKLNNEKMTGGILGILSAYKPEFHEFYKAMAVMDRTDMFEDEKEEESRARDESQGMRGGIIGCEEESQSQGQMYGTTPSVLTVRYNAWHYRNESEAWAGLAVQITKELEATMNVAHRLRTSWRYNWRKRKQSICVSVILPCFLAVFMALWLTTILWVLLDKAKGKDLQKFKYGSLPVTLIVVLWAIVKSVISVVKPISSQMLNYLCLPDHTDKLGYHQKVISDINFLKEELGCKPSWLWNAFGFLWCYATFSWNENYVPGTAMAKKTPSSKENLRMVVFVDDLDRCQENVILQILSAVNLVLVACEINVILGMDKSMIERAIIRKYGGKKNKPNRASEDLADKYLRKIIQLPLDLPDPSHLESQSFLHEQLGMPDRRKEITDSKAQTKPDILYAHRKLNPKFRMGTFISRNPGPEETTGSLGEKAIIKERDYIEGEQNPIEKDKAGKEMTPAPSDKKADKDTNGHPDSSRASETKINMEGTTNIEELPKGQEQHTGNPQPSAFNYQNCHPIQPRGNTEKKISLITDEMLVPKYSQGERDAFCFLQKQATCSRKLPREWKRLLNYHRLAWNILSKSTEVKTLAGWQVQLISWVFVCWQWKDRMNTLIKGWHELGVLKKWITVNDDQEGDKVQESSGPSLREIVENYMDERWPTKKTDTGSPMEITSKVFQTWHKHKMKAPLTAFRRKRLLTATSTACSSFQRMQDEMITLRN